MSRRLEARGVTVVRDSRPIVDDVSATLQPGMFVALNGKVIDFLGTEFQVRSRDPGQSASIAGRDDFPRHSDDGRG